MERLKEFFSKYGIYILVMAIFAVLILLFLPENEGKTKPVDKPNENTIEPTEEEEEPVEEPEKPVKKPAAESKTKTSTLKLTLEGESTISVVKGGTYTEAGYTASDTKDGNLTKQVSVEGTVNTNVVGTYKIKYSVKNSSGKTVTVTRTVNVVADTSTVTVTTDYEPKTLTNQDVTITVKISGDGYSYAIIPGDKETKKTTITYKATANDKYTFTIKKKDGTSVTKTVKITNIDKKKPTASCKNTVGETKTVIKVTASDTNGISKYSYNFNNKKYESETNSYTVKSQVDNVAVAVYDKAGNYTIVTCVRVDNTWPVSVAVDYKTYSAKNYNKSLRYNGKMNYIIYYPDGMDLTKKNPLVVYLHEVSGFGSTIDNTVDLHGENKKVFTGQMRMGKFRTNAVYIAPQCSGKKWADCFTDLKGLIDYIVKKYNIDTKKISITGFSLGGAAVFDFIAKYPGIFSVAVALAPTWINKDAYAKMKDVKIAVFTGTADGNHKINEPDTAYLKDKGVNIKYFPIKDIGHLHIQHEVYQKTNTVDWMTVQSR